MSIIARKYGDFHYAINNECDFELARYAKENKVFAIVSNDSDFFIYDGEWKFWTSSYFGFVGGDKTKIKTVQYDRCGIVKSCGIQAIHRPLFATLIGYDFGGEFHEDLSAFHRRLRHQSSR